MLALFRRNMKGLAVLGAFVVVIVMLGTLIVSVMNDSPIIGFIVLGVCVIVLGGIAQIMLSLRRRY